MFDVFYQGPKPNLFAFEQAASDLKQAADQSRTQFFWFIDGQNDYSDFNFSYTPVPWESQYVHVWPNQWQKDGRVYLASKHNNGNWLFHTEHVQRLPIKEYWDIPEYIDPGSIDWRWAPDPLDPPTNYHFPVKWDWDRVGGPVYRVPGAAGDKYLNDFVATTRIDMTNWVVPTNINQETFDFSWKPHPADPPYIYKFPTVWNSEGGPEYHVPGATQEKYMTELVAETLLDMTHWSVPEEVNAELVDFSWVPHPKDPAYIYHFGTEFQSSVGLTYTVPGATEIKLAGPIPTVGQNRQALEVLDIFYVDHGNDTAANRFERLQAKYPAIQKIRFANSMLDTVRRCTNRAKTNKFWVISSEYVYDDFDFTWHPAPWQNYMTHVFPSQHQKWSNTFLINRTEFDRHAKWANGIEEFPNLNFVKDQQVLKSDSNFNIYYVDHTNPESQSQYELLRSQIRADIVRTRFVDNYLDTFKRIMSTAQTEYVWIINSVCDYSNFDFTWEPEPWQQEMMHVFPSGMEERGNTFYIHVESFKQQMVEFEVMDFFKRINYCNEQNAPYFDIPVHYYETDNLVEEIKKYDFKTPYVLFTNQPDIAFTTAPCLWTEKDRVVGRCSESGATALIPRDIKRHLKTQIYDYPHIETSEYQVNEYYKGRDFLGLDIVYISNGEPDETRWYEHVSSIAQSNVKWVRGVNGRTAAYQEAARQSTTPWFFAVFAKLEVEPRFDWLWMPDYFQEPKHYIFNSRNPVNGLEYGHQGMIAYNKNLVLANNNPGIDFTLSQPHEAVPILSGVAHYNQSAWMTWRTAFREVVKLKHFNSQQPTLETEHRLKVWLTRAEGDFAEWSLKGSADAVEYYATVGGDYNKLMLTFEWQWLSDYFKGKGYGTA